MRNFHCKSLISSTVLLVILAGCGNASDELSTKSNNELADNNSSQTADYDSSNIDLTDIEKDTTQTTLEAADNVDVNNADPNVTDSNANNTEDVSSIATEKEEDPSTIDNAESLKEEYLEKLNTAKKEAEELEATDSSTFALKKVENDRWEIWDELLNEIYGSLKENLPPEEMEKLREEQRNWMKYRDDSALEASLKFKGGTQEHLEYVAVLANVTEERCYELVANYMK